MPPVFTDKGITSVVFLLYLFHIALELYRFAVLNQHSRQRVDLPRKQVFIGHAGRAGRDRAAYTLVVLVDGYECLAVASFDVA